ncbi:DoxX family protein [Anaeromyxobacter dehalogenans 2CP-1]|uniref:DoxX family protein n=1 Tax=Anaeromyxobacter dehalogenans (strain ATCC BAA-258 / DSM 21875 / 2CP-1) TaxID=455488 RepID=B8J5I9_ANAD2|nr:DoxX family protein [Anaeromyxobacter dehalogenans]ACL66851.1 DoxX family protein [Anaeromyxobacter dehalogenans 2CP-1]
MMRFLETDDSTTRLFQRVVLGLVMFPHGAQKLLGWFGGRGLEATLTGFTAGMGLPWLLAVLVILAESVGSVMLVLGVLSRLAALGIASVMVGAIVTVHGQHGFFAPDGFEYHLLALGLALPLVVAGGGRLSLDRALALRRSAGRAHPALPAEG